MGYPKSHAKASGSYLRYCPFNIHTIKPEATITPILDLLSMLLAPFVESKSVVVGPLKLPETVELPVVVDSDAGVDPVELVPALPVLEVVSSLALPDLLDDRDAFSDFTDLTDLALRSALDDFDLNALASGES